jgi:hypothetical protein
VSPDALIAVSQIIQKNHISRTKRNSNILRTAPGTLWERQGALATFLGAISGPSVRV